MKRQHLFQNASFRRLAHYVVPGLCLLGLSFMRLGNSWADSVQDGMAAYQAKNYARAAGLLERGLQQGNRSPNTLFYLGMAYVHSNRLEDARQAFEYVIQGVPPNDPLAAKARNNISYITTVQMQGASNDGSSKPQPGNNTKMAQVVKSTMVSSHSAQANYLSHVISNGKIVHFDSRHMPLKVFISDGTNVPGWNGGMKQAVLYAMQSWQNAGHGRISFTRVYNEANADIVVRWQRNFHDNILGVSPFQMVNNTIVRSDITLAVAYPDSDRAIPMDELNAIAVHEMGHAIGFKGHSPYPDDIMFYSKTREQATLSLRDKNTLSLLYQLDADVENRGGMSAASTQKYYALYKQGLNAQQAGQSAEAIRYYRQALQIGSDMPEAKFNLGALLINAGNSKIRNHDLGGAKQNFEEAVRLYSDILGSSNNPPAGAKENLAAAKTNLALVNGALKP